MKTVRASVALGAVLLMLMACATMNVGTKPLTAKQQYTIAASVYNSTYDDTMNMAKNPNATAVQKEVVLKKKAILTQMRPILLIVGNTLDSGGTPKDADLSALNGFVDQLTTLISGGK